MGKRKRATKPPPKKKTAKLEKIFDCPYCGHEQTVDVAIERDIGVGKASCRVCGARFTSRINRLEEEIDVYAKWIDACEEANRDATAKPAVDPEPAPEHDEHHERARPAPAINDADEADEED